eukprot:IDg16645t1
MQDSGNSFKFTTGNGIWGIKEGRMPHVRDAINLIDTAWAKLPVSAIVRCWLKSEFLALAHEHTLRELMPANDSSVLIEQKLMDTEERYFDCTVIRSPWLAACFVSSKFL